MKSSNAIKIDSEYYAQLVQLKKRDGIPLAESVRRALRFYFTEKLSIIVPEESTPGEVVDRITQGPVNKT